MKKYLLIILLSVSYTYCHCQNGINSGGQFIKNEYGSICSTVGQIDYFSITNNQVYFNAGIQQGYKLNILTSVENVNLNSVNVYPNPILHTIHIESLNDKNQADSFILFSECGSVIKQGNLLGLKNEIEFKNYSRGLYILELFDNEGIKTNTIKLLKEI